MKPTALIAAHLQTLSAITTVASGGVYEDEAPTGVRAPVLIVYEVSGDRFAAHLRMQRPVVQVSAFAQDKATAWDLGSLVIDALGDAQVTIDGTPVVSVYQSDNFFRAQGWWHRPVDLALRYK